MNELNAELPRETLTRLIDRSRSALTQEALEAIDDYIYYEEFGLALEMYVYSVLDDPDTTIDQLPHDALDVVRRLSQQMRLRPHESRLDELKERLDSRP